MRHNNGERDLDCQPGLQAERHAAASHIGHAATLLTSIQAIAGEEFARLGYVTQETRDQLSEAHQTRFDSIAALTNVALRIYEVEQ